MNAPDRNSGGAGDTNDMYPIEYQTFAMIRLLFELFLLGDGEKKVTEEADTRVPSTSMFTFNKEDHTLANVLRAHLMKSSHVIFAGYRVPHPLFSTFELRVQTDGELTPRDAVVHACRELVQDLSMFGREFTKEFELRKLATETNADGR